MQHRVPSPLAFVTIEHLVAGVVPTAVFTDSSDPGPRLGLLVVADGFATVAMTAVLLIHEKPIASPWLLLAAIPARRGPLLLLALNDLVSAAAGFADHLARRRV